MGHQTLDSTQKIALRGVSRADEVVLRAVAAEMVNARVLETASDDADDVDVL
jgi:hypothetical protein